MVIQIETALGRFVARARELFAQEPDLDKRWEKLTPILKELLADPEVQRRSKEWPECVVMDGRAENLLFYEDSDYGFAVNGLTKMPNVHGRIHDHAHIYTLYGVLDGAETIERYKRLDDGSRLDYAEVSMEGSFVVGPGDVDLVPPYQIHTEHSGEERTVAVIIRSEKSGGFLQGRYEPEAKRYYQGYGPRQTPAEM